MSTKDSDAILSCPCCRKQLEEIPKTTLFKTPVCQECFDAERKVRKLWTSERLSGDTWMIFMDYVQQRTQRWVLLQASRKHPAVGDAIEQLQLYSPAAR